MRVGAQRSPEHGYGTSSGGAGLTDHRGAPLGVEGDSPERVPQARAEAHATTVSMVCFMVTSC